MIEVFKDESRCIVEQGISFIKVNKVIHLRLGKELNFIDKIRLTDGTVIQNMQYEIKAEIPTPGELANKLSNFGAVCNYESDKRGEKIENETNLIELINRLEKLTNEQLRELLKHMKKTLINEKESI